MGCLFYDICFLEKNVKTKSFHAQLDFPRIPARYGDELSDLLETMMADDPDDRPEASELLQTEIM